jgi:hypothetical protein
MVVYAEILACERTQVERTRTHHIALGMDWKSVSSSTKPFPLVVVYHGAT